MDMWLDSGEHDEAVEPARISRWKVWVSGVLLLSLPAGLAIWGIVALVMGDVHRNQTWDQWCRDSGGNVFKQTTTGTYVLVGRSSGIVVGGSTTYYCITPDGRMIGLR